MHANLVSYGFSADSKVFANCHVDRQSTVFTKGCDLLHLDTGRTEHVTSTEDYGDGHPASGDATIRRALDPLGVPARAGPWRAPNVELTWTVHEAPPAQMPDTLVFSLRDTASGKTAEIARFDKATEGFWVYPGDAIVSPDGAKLALVVTVVGGPPLFTDVKIVDVQQALAALSAAPAHAP
jgi:hypothetical protein